MRRASNLIEAAEPREKLFGRDAFFSVGLIEGGKKFGFLSGRKLHNCLIASGENSDGRSLWQGEALDDNFAVNYGARNDLHEGMVLERAELVQSDSILNPVSSLKV